MKINFDTEYQPGPLTSGPRPQNENINIRAGRLAENSAGFMVSPGIGADLPVGGTDKAPVTDLAAGLSATDVQLKTDYMSVMSLSMSDEDYGELVRTGQMPEDMDATDSVTILDDIKAALIKGGTEVAGYTDTLDRATLKELTSSDAAAAGLLKKAADTGIDMNDLADSMLRQDLSIDAGRITGILDAVSLAMEALPLSDDATAYMVNNAKSPTIENVYQASNAGSSDGMGGRRYYSEDGYLSRGGNTDPQTEDLEALRPQIEETVRKAGLEVNDDTYSDARLLITRNIPLTPETMLEMDSLRNLRGETDPDRLAGAVSIAMSAGISGYKANLTYSESIYTQAEELKTTLDSIPDKVVDEVIAEGQILNIRNLKQAYERSQAGSIEPVDRNSTETTPEQIHARRILEEARITMSVEANRLLLRSNYRIDIAPMEELVDALKEAEQAMAHRLFPSDDSEVSASRMQTYREVRSEITAIPAMPASILGQYKAAGSLRFGAGEVYTLHEVYESGSARRDAYIRAEESYEALMTAPRRDMGDSIRKAFQNVDDILDDLQIETTEINRRAVRILGYNSIEITADKIEQVREADMMLRGVMDRLTPDRVLNMIRQDVNPLNMPIQELSGFLDEQDSDPERQASDYARFLMQLERQNAITELERDSYIGIYRMLSKLDRTDDAAVGRLMAMGAEMTFAGLLSAMRSSAKSGMDYTVSDDFAGVDLFREGQAIDDQISAAYTTGRFAESARASETVIENLLMSGEKVSPDNLDALNLLRNKRGDWFRPFVKNLKSPADIGKMSDDVLDHMTGAEETERAYTEMLDKARSGLADMVFDADNYLDVRSLRTSMKQINILSSIARDEVYDLPAEIDGEYTSIRLTVRHESGAGRVAVTMSTVSCGMIAAEFSLRGNMSGYIAYESDEAYSRLGDQMDKFTEALGFSPELVHSDRIDPDNYTDGFFNFEKAQNGIKDEAGASDINNIELYRTARSFISVLKAI
ncbi:MAG: DUF6240 domain-containing protein [Lachnospiraceae bacterium]|nr:DUF6240 domain-containing protein [Lachnospiraceae bacterium]